jgi:hypothetical protein
MRRAIVGKENPEVKRRTIKTTVEIYRIIIHSPPPVHGIADCSECATARGSLVSPEEAASLTGLTVRTIYAAVEAGSLHYRELEDGSLLVCLNSFPSLRPSDLSLTKRFNR